MLSYGFMQLALVAAVLVGLTAPTVGIYLVQRRLSLIGDGLGHMALLGVAVALATRTALPNRLFPVAWQLRRFQSRRCRRRRSQS